MRVLLEYISKKEKKDIPTMDHKIRVSFEILGSTFEYHVTKKMMLM